ncbi:hypothetical protein IFM89_005917 [Coptis chinensis]|uniref:Aldehyde dehydrogenase domain-containing protein n=1 Tax=Coptis chinensis TaxID=261450 RepID=A0A835HRA3_9MAGN|nr:hypothetical protein IFM89_005917 [Coptis chinensis]
MDRLEEEVAGLKMNLYAIKEYLDEAFIGIMSHINNIEKRIQVEYLGDVEIPSYTHCYFHYMDEVPEVVRPFTLDIEEPMGDGTGGFIALALALGYRKKNWIKVQADLLVELSCFKQEYVKMFSVHGFKNCVESLLKSGTDEFMKMPETGYLAASKYHTAVVFFSEAKSVTFLPLRSAIPKNGPKVISIGLVENKMLNLKLKRNYPMPEIAKLWFDYHYPTNGDWETYFQSRFDAYKKVVACYYSSCFYRLRADWLEAYYRKRVAWATLKKFNLAANAFSEGLRRDPEDKELQIALRNNGLQAAAVTLSELGEYGQAASLLEKLSKVCESINFEVLRGLTNVLLAANKPDQVVACYQNMSQVTERKVELAKLESIDSGKPLDEASWDIDDVAGCFEYYAELAEGLDAKQKAPITLPMETFKTHVLKEPIGVVGLITPWNYPLLMATWKVAPALAAGCAAILKPSELSSLTCLELADVCREVGLPPGVLNILTGLGPDAGAPLASHPHMDKIAFTGSTATGSRIASLIVVRA